MAVKILRDDIKSVLDFSPKYRELLFRRGYLFTDKKQIGVENYPFYNLWKEYKIQKFFLYVQEKQTVYIQSVDGISVIIIGHAYNPFDMKCDENQLCYDLLEAYSEADTSAEVVKVQNDFLESKQ